MTPVDSHSKLLVLSLDVYSRAYERSQRDLPVPKLATDSEALDEVVETSLEGGGSVWSGLGGEDRDGVDAIRVEAGPATLGGVGKSSRGDGSAGLILR